jgi:hypothetical protein
MASAFSSAADDPLITYSLSSSTKFITS